VEPAAAQGALAAVIVDLNDAFAFYVGTPAARARLMQPDIPLCTPLFIVGYHNLIIGHGTPLGERAVERVSVSCGQVNPAYRQAGVFTFTSGLRRTLESDAQESVY